ncbi:YecH family metal-binding protein [Vibrio paucivorans]
MSNEIHAHKVLNLLRENSMTEAELRTAVAQQFGPEARFHTCSKQGFDLDALLVFFIQREKVIKQGEKWTLNAERVCNH